MSSADGLAEDITSSLSRFSYLLVSSRNSTRTFERNLEDTDMFEVQNEITNGVASTVADPYGVVVRTMAASTASKSLGMILWSRSPAPTLLEDGMPVRIVQLGSARGADEGLRIGTVRRPPRGVPRERFAEDDWYDVWIPELAPSAGLVKEALAAETDEQWRSFVRKYRKEMSDPLPGRLLDLLAALSHQTSFSVGCYCDDEARCHRSVLRGLLQERGAAVS